MRAIQISEPGGPEALQHADVTAPEPATGQVRVRVAAAGVNFIDVYYRTGAYPLDLPATLGLEGAGTVEAVGDGVRDLAEGDRVAWPQQDGSYAEVVVVDAEKVVPVPKTVDLRTAAAVMLQGMTAHYLASDTYPLSPGDVAVVHAASGGVGHLLVQIAKRRGATVIATTSTDRKADLAREAGADHVVRYDQVDVPESVDTIAPDGVAVVYDSVGKATFDGSLACLRPRGCMVLYGQSSGPVPPVDPQRLNQAGSLYLTRPRLGHYIATRSELLGRAGDLFDWIAAGELTVRIDRTWPLGEVAEAHRYLEDRKTHGKLLLEP